MTTANLEAMAFRNGRKAANGIDLRNMEQDEKGNELQEERCPPVTVIDKQF